MPDLKDTKYRAIRRLLVIALLFFRLVRLALEVIKQLLKLLG